MRLIDADELIYMTIGEDTDMKFEFVPTEFIENADEVEAIPVEWLKNYAHCTLTDSCQDHDIVKWCEQMLEDWNEEKEIEHYQKVLERRK